LDGKATADVFTLVITVFYLWSEFFEARPERKKNEPDRVPLTSPSKVLWSSALAAHLACAM
jgi:hypothetical protein